MSSENQIPIIEPPKSKRSERYRSMRSELIQSNNDFQSPRENEDLDEGSPLKVQNAETKLLDCIFVEMKKSSNISAIPSNPSSKIPAGRKKSYNSTVLKNKKKINKSLVDIVGTGAKEKFYLNDNDA